MIVIRLMCHHVINTYTVQSICDAPKGENLMHADELLHHINYSYRRNDPCHKSAVPTTHVDSENVFLHLHNCVRY